MARTRILQTTALTCAVVAACQPQKPVPGLSPAPAASDAPTPTIATPVALDNAALDAFLISVYGDGASHAQPWKHAPAQVGFRDSAAKAGEQEQVTRQLCADLNTTQGGQPVRLVAICGQPDDYGHSTLGMTDFFLLRMQDGKAVASAQQHLQNYGSMGSPGDVKVIQFGADMWGFVVNSNFTNMGYSLSSWSLVLPKAGGFVDAGYLRSHIDNLGTIEGCDDDRVACADPRAFDIDFALDTDRSHADAAHWPLVVTESGPACGQLANAIHRVLLDPETMRYQIPNILKRETCEDDWTE